MKFYSTSYRYLKGIRSTQRSLELHNELREEVDRYCNLIKNNSPVILQLEKLTFNEIGGFTKDKQIPAKQFIPNYAKSEEATERRLAFLERRPIDPSKNLPFIKIQPGDRS